MAGTVGLRRPDRKKYLLCVDKKAMELWREVVKEYKQINRSEWEAEQAVSAAMRGEEAHGEVVGERGGAEEGD